MTTAIETTNALAERPNLDFSQGERGKHVGKTAATNTSLDIVELDKFCADYLSQKDIESLAKDEIATLKAFIVQLVKKYGNVPDNAPKSKRLEPEDHIATITVSTTLEVDDQVCAELEALLKKARLTRKFRQMFATEKVYSMTSQYSHIVKHTDWPESIAVDVMRLLMRVVKAKESNPSLTVVSRAELERQQKEAAEKLAAKKAEKAAKKGGR